MNSHKRRPWLARCEVLVLVFILVMAVGPVARPANQALAAGVAVGGRQALDPASDLGTPVFIPLLMRNFPDLSIYGADIGAMTDANGLQLMAEVGATWIRRGAVQWNQVEATEGVYDWSKLSGLETELLNAQADHMKIILVVRGTPAWAQKVSGYSCGAILQAKFGEFAAFVSQLVTRYSVSPYNVLYWEIWNEPDIAPEQVQTNPDSYWGCWGDESDQSYYGGDYYASVLQVVYPAVKAANPNAQVLVGGLLLDCDPNIPPGTYCGPPTQASSRFIEGVLHGGGGPYFDGIAFHAYDYVAGTTQGSYGNPNWTSRWSTTGPVVTAKANYLKGLLTTYGVTGKYLMNTEAAVLCDIKPSQTCGSVWEQTKACYVAEDYATGIKLGLRANIWYFWWNPSWDRHSQLFNSDLTLLPAYTAYSTVRNELADGAYVQDITGFTGLNGYKIQRRDRSVWILWAVDGTSHSITLPGTPVAAYDVYGASLPTSSPFPVARSPVYLEWIP
jgi:hypothetical protein